MPYQSRPQAVQPVRGVGIDSGRRRTEQGPVRLQPRTSVSAAHKVIASGCMNDADVSRLESVQAPTRTPAPRTRTGSNVKTCSRKVRRAFSAALARYVPCTICRGIDAGEPLITSNRFQLCFSRVQFAGSARWFALGQSDDLTPRHGFVNSGDNAAHLDVACAAAWLFHVDFAAALRSCLHAVRSRDVSRHGLDGRAVSVLLCGLARHSINHDRGGKRSRNTTAFFLLAACECAFVRAAAAVIRV